ncbi:MAG: hypothetical protein IIY70_06450 [Oscillospiraceae bacterium]|nr:hypothetical protein [Oscillospiraceae bacterium]
MYCVKCGVQLAEGISRCPLCQTPVWNPDESVVAEATFSDRYPQPPKSRRYPILAFLTVLLLAASLSTLILCLTLHGRVAWSGYVMLGCALVYFAGIFPFWFERREPLIFVPLTFLLTAGYLLYICLYTGGHWYWSFAFPVTMLIGALATLSVALFRFGKRRRLIKTGALLVSIGCSAMLIEFFEALSFGTTMFLWSLYPVCCFSLLGLFLILCGLIPSWRDYVERKLFL